MVTTGLGDKTIVCANVYVYICVHFCVCTHVFVNNPDLDLPPGLVGVVVVGVSIGELMDWFANAVLRPTFLQHKTRST